MGVKVDGACGATYGDRSAERVNQRNGYRPRRLDTRVGTLELAIPKLRAGSYYPAWLLAPRRRTERALVAVVAECYLRGVSTRRWRAGGDARHPEPVQVAALRAGQDPRGGSGGVPAGRWTPALTRMSGWMRWRSSAGRRGGSSTWPVWSRPGSTPTATGRSSGSTCAPARTAPGGRCS
jgi:Transposase, Mutator family